MPVLVVIPARLGSTRLPRKPLQPLGGAPLIVRVAERIQAHGIADRLVIGADSEIVVSAARDAGFEALLTEPERRSGSDRVYEVSARPEFAGYDEIVNVQGDAPFLSLAALAGALIQLRKGFDVGTAAVPLDSERVGEPSRVKVVTNRAGRALYFSRAAIPFGGERYWQHLGVYAYTRDALRRFAQAPPSPLELAERLEQLRALELGLTIGVELVQETAGPAVDTLDDLREAEELWTLMHEVTR